MMLRGWYMTGNGIEITINGRCHAVTADATTPLLTVLRNELGLNSPRYGCGLGKCGACTVHLDGAAVLSCTISVADASGSQITTLEGLEGLGRDGALHPLQDAFLQEQAAQCGYCIPGIIMAAAALLASNPHPSELDIRAALAVNLCRCGSHGRILRAIQRAAHPESTP
ncbi:MAG: (2Fe-2S)-binding protein [Chloroflexota bacterium]|nr:(2Fe-2S)-binding protein [Chloroflexota bacterium]